MSLNEPIVFDAYIRSEFETAFRENIMRTPLPPTEEGVGKNNTYATFACTRENLPIFVEVPQRCFQHVYLSILFMGFS